MKYIFYYRGCLSSCNYHCEYCPFSKNKESDESLYLDEHQLKCFISFIDDRGKRGDMVSVFFCPWGEALIHPWYQQAMIDLSHRKHVEKVVIQTNLSCDLAWVGKVNRKTFALWTTYHPGETREEAFLSQCSILDAAGASYSVGSVGTKENMRQIRSLRSRLPSNIYLWVNALKDRNDYYYDEEINFLQQVDPYFQYNLQDYKSKGKVCNTGDSVMFILGDGTVRRCHFTGDVLGNIYKQELSSITAVTVCPANRCRCYMGYIHLPDLNFSAVYGNRILERIPSDGRYR